MDEELINLRIDQLPLNGILKGTYFFPIRNMDTQKTERVPLSAILTSGTSANFEWITDNDPGYAEDEVVTYGGKWWQSLIDDNLNITPGTNPLAWIELQKAPSGFVFWQAGVFPQDEVFVLYEISPGSVQIYHLTNATRPYVSADFEAELALGDWQIISEGQTHFKGVFASEAALEIAFPDAEPGDYALVDTAGPDAQLYIWDETDTDWIASGVTTIVPPWDDTTPGIVERSTQAESEAIATQVAAGAVGALSGSRAPSEIGQYHLLVSFLTKALTWGAKQTFTTAPRFSSTTATTFLGVDSNKDLVSIPEASQAEMITGTAQNRLATPKSVEDKGSVKSRSITNGATGTTNIDCLLANQFNAIFNTTVTGNIIITKTNDTNLELLNITIPITGATITIEFPSDTRMDRVLESTIWAQSTKILTVNAIGTADVFEFSLKRNGSTFIIRNGGPSRA
jgi:hypothetical protein